jgi:hypothetical protein
VLDDVESDRESNPVAWTPAALFTWKEFSLAELKDRKLSERELAQIGENLLLRLLALHGHIK